jgi:hypothetical protein
MCATLSLAESVPKFSSPHPSMDERGPTRDSYRNLSTSGSRSASANNEQCNRDQEEDDTDINGAEGIHKFGHLAHSLGVCFIFDLLCRKAVSNQALKQAPNRSVFGLKQKGALILRK